jgi:hypothetical protein
VNLVSTHGIYILTKYFIYYQFPFPTPEGEFSVQKLNLRSKHPIILITNNNNNNFTRRKETNYTPDTKELLYSWITLTQNLVSRNQNHCV